MLKRYPVLVYTKTGKRTRHGFMLWIYGLKYAGNGRYEGYISKYVFKRLSSFCKYKRLKCVTNNSYGERSADYRKKFFRAYPPTIWSGYFCSYCGFYIPKKKISVDHLYPIGKASSDISIQKWLRFLGIDDINSVKNLAPACKRCNQRKGAKLGIWLIRGYLGRIQWLWYIRWFVRFILLGFIIWLIYRLSTLSDMDAYKYINDFLVMIIG